MMLTDEPGSGLCVTTSKGRPCRTRLSINDETLNKSYQEIKIREKLKLSDSQSLLLAVAWVIDSEQRLVSMHPKVLFMDVTMQTNKEKRGLFLVAGKDANSKGFTAARIFLPSEQRWVFHWIFRHCLPKLLTEQVIAMNQLVITDGDSDAYIPLWNLMQTRTIWKGTHSHLLVQGWRLGVAKHITSSSKSLGETDLPMSRAFHCFMICVSATLCCCHTRYVFQLKLLIGGYNHGSGILSHSANTIILGTP
ncbi:MAG: hypothetical protein ACREBR_04060 [bacterium]